jgi:hypothetical protein
LSSSTSKALSSIPSTETNNNIVKSLLFIIKSQLEKKKKKEGIEAHTFRSTAGNIKSCLTLSLGKLPKVPGSLNA